MVESKSQPLEQVLVKTGHVVNPKPHDLRHSLAQHPLLLLLVSGHLIVLLLEEVVLVMVYADTSAHIDIQLLLAEFVDLQVVDVVCNDAVELPRLLLDWRQD